MTSVFSSLVFQRKPVSPTITTSPAAHNAALSGSWIVADSAINADHVFDDPEADDLNSSLDLLCALFPDVQPAVFRELIPKLSKQSRVAIVAERILKDKEKWVRGRYHSPAALQERPGGATPSSDSTTARQTQCFRSREYRLAVKNALYSEFKGLSKSSIKAVLAEQNYSYATSRPVLHQISSKTWRFYFARFWTQRSDDAMAPENHPLINWQNPNGVDGPRMAFLKPTASAELNAEIYVQYIAPTLKLHVERCSATDAVLVLKMASEDAAENGALFECQCCYDDAIFERMVVCGNHFHMICHECVHRAMKEAIYGQGWTKTVDMTRTTLRCLGPEGQSGDCTISPALVKQALFTQDDDRLWHDFEEQVAKHNCNAAAVPLFRCAFCPYAEMDEFPGARLAQYLDARRRLLLHIGPRIPSALDTLTTGIADFVFMNLFYIVWLLVLLLQFFGPEVFSDALRRVQLTRRGLRFKCLNPRCKTASCLRCGVQWRDPHTCFEDSTTSLRQAIEAATTNVVKRVCPRCHTSFVRSGGCNKMSCPCGYKMCYLCRAEITDTGYTHFCQHFRPEAGSCSECTRCELYHAPDEAQAIKLAAEQAEVLWRAKNEDKQGLSEERIRSVRSDMLRAAPSRFAWTAGWQQVLDVVVDIMVDAQ